MPTSLSRLWPIAGATVALVLIAAAIAPAAEANTAHHHPSRAAIAAASDTLDPAQTVSPSVATPASTITVSGTNCVQLDPDQTPVVGVTITPVDSSDPLVYAFAFPDESGAWSVAVELTSNDTESPAPLANGSYTVDSNCDDYVTDWSYALASLTVQTFADVSPASTFGADIQWMYDSGISTGYVDSNNLRTYQPASAVSRRAMAAFLYRDAGSPSFTPPVTPSFTDVPTSEAFYKQIEWMKAEGISSGNANGTYAPDSPVSRQAMAAFLYRFAGSPIFSPPTTPSFSDVPSTSTFYKQIEWMKAEGISTGNANGTYAPLNAVSRQAMAAFLHRASSPTPV